MSISEFLEAIRLTRRLLMNWYQKISVTIALLTYALLGYQILKGTARQNFASYFLWAALDGIAGVSIYIQGGNYYLPLLYAFGSGGIIFCVLKKGTWEWGTYEQMISVLVVLCIIAWKVSGPWHATIFSTLGAVLAGLPQVRDAWRDPTTSPITAYVGYGLANVASTLGGSAWTVEERLYPFACLVLSFLVIGASLRRVRERSIEV